jgi:hypothetical protein
VITIDLGISASGSNNFKHRNHEPCRRTAHKLRTQRARERIQVCMLDPSWMCFNADNSPLIRQVWVHQSMVNWLVKHIYLSRRTMSTNVSNKHDTNRPKYAGIPEAVLE